jgi:hypothetical protein
MLDRASSVLATLSWLTGTTRCFHWILQQACKKRRAQTLPISCCQPSASFAKLLQPFPALTAC